jgi:hypothetical protein
MIGTTSLGKADNEEPMIHGKRLKAVYDKAGLDATFQIVEGGRARLFGLDTWRPSISRQKAGQTDPRHVWQAAAW